MKIVKTQSRWKLHRFGFPVALRFNDYHEFMNSKVEQWCKQHLGRETWMRDEKNRSGEWTTHWGSPTSQGRPYFIGFRDPGNITMLTLALSLELEKSADIFG